MSAHTPGPWFVDGLIVTARQKGSIGFAYGPAMPENSAVGRASLANARLIAAAPELLAALQSLLSDWDAVCGSHGWDKNHLCGPVDARAAIAKATGSEQ